MSESTPNNTPPSDVKSLKTQYILGAVALVVIAVAVIFAIISKKPGLDGSDLTITNFTPQGQTPQTTNITITFSGDVIADSLVSQTLDAYPLKITPEIPGVARWISTDQLRIFPSVFLAPSTEYTVEVDPKKIPGLSSKSDRQFSFHTEQFKVKDALLSFEQNPAQPQEFFLTASIEFNYPVDPKDIGEYFEIYYEGGKKIPFQTTTTKPSQFIKLETEEEVKRDDDKSKNIRLKIKKDAPCVGGNLGLEKDFITPIVLKGEERLTIKRVSIDQDGRYGTIKIEFSSPVYAGVAKPYISIEPNVSMRMVEQHRYLKLEGQFEVGDSYNITIRKGLVARDGAKLEQNFQQQVTLRHLDPTVDFVGDGIYLSRHGNLNVGLSTINVSKVRLSIEKVFANNLTYLTTDTDLTDSYSWVDMSRLGKTLYSEEIAIQMERNQEVVTPVNLREYMQDEKTGVFRLRARDTERYWRYSDKWVMITDMGITMKRTANDLIVWVNSLSTLEPISGAVILVKSYNNQLILQGRTNMDGVAIFKNVNVEFKEYDPYLIIAEKDQDLSFVQFRRQISLTDFDVSGSPMLQNGYRAFVYTDRGVYRPGETAHVATMVRGVENSVPQSFPLRLEVIGPDSRLLDEYRQSLGGNGACEFNVPFPDYAKTGRYTAKVMVGNDHEIGRETFNVEEFVPDRIKVNVETDDDAYQAGDVAHIEVTGMNLFGPPAAGRRVNIEYQIRAKSYSPPTAYQSFTFNYPGRAFSQIRETLVEDVLDDAGRYYTTWDIPTDLFPSSSLQGRISATVLEPGGRGVTNFKTFTIHPYDCYIGLRRPEGYAEINEPTDIDLIVLNNYGKIEAGRQLSVQVYRIYWHSILRQQPDGRMRYVSDEVEELVDSYTLISPSDIQQIRFTPDDYGRYRVEVHDEVTDAVSSISFYASGWGWSPWAMENPDRLELDLDKEQYQAGDVATVQVKAPFNGKLLLTVERDNVLSMQTVDMPENTATISIPVKDIYQPNVYVSASLIRSTDNLERHAPVRAFGVAPLMVDCKDKQLSIEMNAPENMRPHQKLTVDLEVSGNNGEPAYCTIAAVDEGICQLTAFQTPDPFAHFYGKKQLDVETYDLYGLILPEVESTQLLLTPSGDADYTRKRLNPVSVQRIKPVAMWSGLVETDKKGRAKVDFDVPQFNGSLRVMAVAASGKNFGSAEKNVIVREPIVLTPTIPLFVASGDQFQIPVTVFNGTGKRGDFTVELKVDGPIKLENSRQSVKLDHEAEAVVTFNANAEMAIGKASFTLTAKGNGQTSTINTDVPVRPPNPPITLTGSGAVGANATQAFSFPTDVQFIGETAEFNLTLSPLPTVELGSGLEYLLHYPHGCVEQTTSQLFPLLAFDDMAKVVDPAQFQNNSSDYYLNEGILKLERMQLSSGLFSYWPGGDYANTWGSIYASHFLVEAKLAGYQVSSRVYKNMQRGLRDIVLGSDDTSYSGLSQIVYACYVLARMGSPEKSMMYYLKHNRLDEMSTEAQYLLAGAFGYAGDVSSALELLPATVQAPGDNSRETGGNFYSPMRAKAIMLSVFADILPDHSGVPKLVEELSTMLQGRGGYRYTTHSSGYAFLALGKILKQNPSQDYKGTVLVDGREYKTFGGKDTFFADKTWDGKTVTIQNEGPGTCYFYWKAFGVPTDQNVEEEDHQLMVRRVYLTEDGERATYDDFKSGDLVIGKITIEALAEDLDNVAVVDLLPAGFEIENPRLQSRANIDWINSDTRFDTDHMDIRDDRLLIFGDLIRRKPKTFYYGIRVVNMGEFSLPPITAEAMYDPAKRSIASSGKVVVKGF